MRCVKQHRFRLGTGRLVQRLGFFRATDPLGRKEDEVIGTTSPFIILRVESVKWSKEIREKKLRDYHNESPVTYRIAREPGRRRYCKTVSLLWFRMIPRLVSGRRKKVAFISRSCERYHSIQ